MEMEILILVAGFSLVVILFILFVRTLLDNREQEKELSREIIECKRKVRT